MVHPATVVVSLHDVAPSRLEQVRWLLQALDRIDARPRVLKVIPAEPGATPQSYGPLLDLVQKERAAGSEIVLHGWSHRVDHPLAGAGLARARAQIFAAGEAEFAGLDRAQAAHRLLAGRRRLTEAGLEVEGFCAPAWIAPPWLPDLLAELGFGHYVGMSALIDLRRGRRRFLPLGGQMGAGPGHEAMIGVASRLLLATAPRTRPVKVFFHPAGVPEAPSVHRTLALLARLLESRRPTTYQELLAGRC